MGNPAPSLTYANYLALDELLSAQHELGHLQERLEAGDGSHALHTLRRVLTVLKVAVAQIDVLETMTPRQFTSFRDRLEAASGFQSAQFRQLEAVLGRRDRDVLRAYPEPSEARQRIAAALERRSVFDSFLRYLDRLGYPVPRRELDRDVRRPAELSPEVQAVLLTVYRDDGEAAQVAERLVDLDEGLQEWRYRHVKMVERTIGGQRGTGGSQGATYLSSTLGKPTFPDLWAVRTLG